jgi:transposase
LARGVRVKSSANSRWEVKSVVHRHEMSEVVWARLQPLLPVHTRGKPRTDDRLMINAILWKLATGAPWRDLPERYGPWSSVHTRFRRWTRAGVWDRIVAAVQRDADAAGQLDWSVHFVDGTVVRAHQHAAGGKGGRSGRRSVAARAASRRRSTCAPMGPASR